MTRPFNVKLARAEIGSLRAEPAAWLTIRVFGETNRPSLEDPSRRDGFVSEYPSPGSGAKP